MNLECFLSELNIQKPPALPLPRGGWGGPPSLFFLNCVAAPAGPPPAFLMNFHESKLIKRLPYAIIN